MENPLDLEADALPIEPPRSMDPSDLRLPFGGEGHTCRKPAVIALSGPNNIFLFFYFVNVLSGGPALSDEMESMKSAAHGSN